LFASFAAPPRRGSWVKVGDFEKKRRVSSPPAAVDF
jgi:hypothetical protein